MTDENKDGASETSARSDVISGPETQTPSGAPTDKAHEEAGDGTLQGSIPAGLSLDELQKIAEDDQSVDSGTG
jgi:hypothetical protein